MKELLLLMAAVAAALPGSSTLAQHATTKALDDSVLRERLVGTWTRQSQPNQTNTVTVSFSFRADATYSNHVTSFVGGSARPDYNTGDWEIQKEVLIRTVRRTSDPLVIAVGTVARWTVENLDDRQLVVKNSRNATTRFERAR